MAEPQGKRVKVLAYLVLSVLPTFATAERTVIIPLECDIQEPCEKIVVEYTTLLDALLIFPSGVL